MSGPRPSILVTRPAAQAGELMALLDERGIDAVPVPMVAIEPTLDGALEGVLNGLGEGDWLVVTSANGAEAVLHHFADGGMRQLSRVRLAAVGPATADVLRRAGLTVDHVPARYLTAEIASGLGDVTGRHVALARADAATEDLAEALRARGAIVTESVAYRIVIGPAASRDPLRAALHGALDGISFTSSSTVRGLMGLASPIDRGRARSRPAFCIGPVTAATARGHGFDVAAVADDHTAPGLADAIARHFGRPER